MTCRRVLDARPPPANCFFSAAGATVCDQGRVGCVSRSPSPPTTPTPSRIPHPHSHPSPTTTPGNSARPPAKRKSKASSPGETPILATASPPPQHAQSFCHDPPRPQISAISRPPPPRNKAGPTASIQARRSSSIPVLSRKLTAVCFVSFGQRQHQQPMPHRARAKQRRARGSPCQCLSSPVSDVRRGANQYLSHGAGSAACG